MDVLILAFLTWISAHTGLPSVDTVPEIAFSTPGEIESLNASDMEYRSDGDATRTVALYDLEHRVIHLPAGWSERDPVALSVLLHELVHHVQVVSGQEYACRGAMEKVALRCADRLSRFHWGSTCSKPWA